MTLPESLPAVLARLDAWLLRELPEVSADLRPGAAQAELDDLEVRLGQRLPEDVRTLYAWHDGQEERGYTTGVFFGLPMLCLAEVRRHWLDWQDIIEQLPHSAVEGWDIFDDYTSTPPGAVRLLYVVPGYIPFAHDHGGNHLAVDLDPGPAGTRGQVINFGRDEDDKIALASSMTDFLSWMVGQYEAGNFAITQHPDGTRELNMREPRTTHFLDALHVLHRTRRG